MHPMSFKEQTCVLSKPENMTHEECVSLPVFRDGKQCVSAWKMSFKERLSALLFGKLWLYVLSGETQPPVAVFVTRTIFGRKRMKEKKDDV